MSISEATANQTFEYQAQTGSGLAMNGTIVASGLDQASAALRDAGLRVLQMEAVATEQGRPARVAGADFHAFNQQLAQLTQSGLPVESGLRLIARDMRQRRVAASIERLAQELDRGVPLAKAFEKHGRRFPPLYGKLIDAGVRSGQLPAVLFNFGRHLDLVQRLRATLWRAAAYPIVLIVIILCVLGFMAWSIMPGFEKIFADFDTQLPELTRVVFAIGRWVPVILIAIAAFAGALLILIAALRVAGRLQWFIDYLVMPMPLIGSVLRLSAVARWCDALRLGVDAGMDLPAAIDLAGQAVGSPRAQRDGAKLRRALEAGGEITSAGPLSLVPATVPATMKFGSQRGDLVSVLQSLAAMYEELAEVRLGAIQTILTPAAVLVVGLMLATIASAVFLPLIALMNSLME